MKFDGNILHVGFNFIQLNKMKNMLNFK